MAHHLAALVTAAETADAVTVDQRTEIVDLILKIWRARRTLPGDVPAHDLDMVFAALDMLGDDRPWRFSRLQKYADDLDAARAAAVPLVVKAVLLERTTRQAVLALIWLACEDAASRNEEWLVTAASAMAPLEDELAATTQSVRRRLRDFLGDEPFSGLDTEQKPKIDSIVLGGRLRAMAETLTGLANELDGDTSTSAATNQDAQHGPSTEG
ncbi:hypothetical protein [Luteipulveratus halotolerans]|uniref:Uncharacterized protein n=1 Tax=Luteipulveratus halotolerans TaxID=1631356 RepID=A0A0L6CGQ4_9MICO|nr:hypothetical protein [Luteipulveratus halotolerans]KNX36977.1 hypothetical protein VV01_07145 [Luteipulveratus halotolerans]